MAQSLDDAVQALNTLHTTFTGHVDAIAGAAQAATDAATAKAAAESDAASIDATKTIVDGQAADIAQAIADINAAIVPKLPLLNIIKDGGRYVDSSQDFTKRAITGSFDATQGIEVGLNGATVEDGGLFVNNNSTNGGTAAALPQPISDLLAAMGRAGSAARFGVDFYISKWTAGAGTSSAYNDHYLMHFGSNTATLSMDNGASYAAWVRCVASSCIIRPPTQHFLNGVEEVGDVTLTPADGWVHVAGILENSNGNFSFGCPDIYGKSDTILEIALPVLVPARVQLPVHTQPLLPVI